MPIVVLDSGGAPMAGVAVEVRVALRGEPGLQPKATDRERR